MKSARGEPVARTGPEGQNSLRLDPRVGFHRQQPLTVVEMPAPDIDLFVEEWPVGAWMDDAFPGIFRHHHEAEKVLWTPAVSYMNFVIANHAVLVPAYWREGLPERVREDDERARAILAKAFPERRIVQIDPLPINWLGGGMHCTTQQQPRVAR